MIASSWPDPPVHGAKAPPKIPDAFMEFGVAYRMHDGCPQIDMKKAPVSAAEILALVDASYSNFCRLVRTFDPKHLNEIRSIHVRMNELLNEAIPLSGPHALGRAARDRLAERRRLRDAIRRYLGVAASKPNAAASNPGSPTPDK